MQELHTVEQIIAALGGQRAVRSLLGGNLKYNVVWNWCERKAFPPNTYKALKAALNAQGIDAPASLWGMLEPETPSSAADQESAP